MGLFNSEHVENSGDHQTHVINHLESHTDALAKSDLKVWIVIALLVAQWLLILYKHHKKNNRANRRLRQHIASLSYKMRDTRL